ncbi:DUF1033 family protein [Siminovitchia sediminis]|uniref:DUF1033 family protein n=1 Tax=Siminovitchia sediminis TaxID=1274353 RepID=A0ABW4KEX1_9BACI
MVQQWEVIVMKGESEPWWFFPEWRNDIIELYTFSEKEAAIRRYMSRFRELKNKCQYVKVKKTSLAAFWNEGDRAYCEQCEDDLQLYYGLLILLNGEPYEFTEKTVNG